MPKNPISSYNEYKKLKDVIEDIKKNYLVNWKEKKKEELNKQLIGLVYKDGEKKGEKISEELQMSVEYLLDEQKNITEESRDNSLLIKKKDKILSNLSKWIERKKLEKICELKSQLVWLEKFGKLKDPLDDIKIFKSFLDSTLEVSKENNRLSGKLSELTKEVKKLLEQIKEKDRRFGEILVIGKNGDGKLTTNDLQNNNTYPTEKREAQIINNAITEPNGEQRCKLKNCLTNKVNLGKVIKTIEVWQTKTIIEKVESFLKVRNDFLFSLEEVITELQICYNRLKENTSVKHLKIDVMIKSVNDIGGAITPPIKVVNPIKLVAAVITACHDYYKIDFRAKRSEEFKRCLENDEEDIFLFNDAYNSLAFIYENKDLEISSNVVDILKLELKSENGETKCFKPFNIRYERIHNIVNSRKEEYWTVEDMKGKISSLSTDLNALKLELEGEEIFFKEIKNKLNEVQTQIEVPPKQN